MSSNQPTHDPAEVDRRIGAVLHGHLDPIGASVDLTDAVVARSRRIQRGRAIATGAALAVAAIAVATPLAWTALRGASDPTVPAASPTVASSVVTTTPPDSTPTTSPPPSTGGPTSQPPTSAATVPQVPNQTIPDGAAKTVSADGTFAKAPDATGLAGPETWTVGKVLHREGRIVTLEVGDPWEYVPLAGGQGLVIEGAFEKERTVGLVGADGRKVEELVVLPASHSMTSTVASADGTRVALYAYDPAGKGNDARIYAWDSSGRRLAEKSNLVHTAHVAGWYGGRLFLGNHTSRHSYTWDLQTNVIDNYYDGAPLASVNAAGVGATYTPTDADGFTGCTQILDVTAAAPQVRASYCGDFQATGPSALSPDGRYLAGSNAYVDGAGPTVVKVLDTTTGRIVLEVKDGTFMDYGFLPDGSLALDVLKSFGTASPSQVLLRCTTAGACVRLTDELTGASEFGRPMKLHLLSAR